MIKNKIMTEEQYNEWFKSLWSGTESYGNSSLHGKNDKYSLIRIKHPGSYLRFGGKLNGFTEWFVAINGTNNFAGYCPDYVWKKEGRLLNDDKTLIEKDFNIKFHK